jgi:hypothetical protein
MSQFRIQCPGCQATLQVKQEMRGKQIACPKCKKCLQLPATPAVKAAMNAASNAPAKDETGPLDYLPDPIVAQSGFPSPAASSSLWQSGGLSASIPTPSFPAYSAPQQASAYNTRPQPRRTGDREMTSADENMQSTAIFLIVVPILAAILPLFGLQLRRLASSGEHAPLGAMILGFIGAGIVVYARRGRSDAIVAGIAAIMITLVFGVGGFLLQRGDYAQEEGVSTNPAGPRQATPLGNFQSGRNRSQSVPLSDKNREESQRIFEENRQRALEIEKMHKREVEEMRRSMMDNQPKLPPPIRSSKNPSNSSPDQFGPRDEFPGLGR